MSEDFFTPRLVTANSLRLPLPDESTPCVVTSPPYNVQIVGYASGYADNDPWPVYAAKVRVWSQQIARILEPGGRAWVNIQPTVPFRVGDIGGERVNLAHMWMDGLARAGLAYRDTVAWVQDSFDGGCAWGSWCKPSAPNLRGGWETILLYYKPPWKRTPRPVFEKWTDERENLGGDWADLTRNVWKINSANTRKKGVVPVPAAFPIEVPARCIRLSTYPQEVVVDPFGGSGTTGRAAEQLGRRSILVDLGWGG